MTTEPVNGEPRSHAEGEGFAGVMLSVSLTVADVHRSLAWYRDALGLSVRKVFEREGKVMAASMAGGAVRILLSQDDGAHGAERVKGVGFSMMLSTAQSIDGIADRARKAGAVLDTEPTDLWGQRVFRLRDLDGFRLTISSGIPE